MTTPCRGVVEGISRNGLHGWVAPSDAADRPLRVVVRIAGIEAATIPAALPRDDVRDAGLSAAGRCGFEFVFSRTLPADAVATVTVEVADTGQILPSAGGAGVNLYDRLFTGSYAVDTTVPEGAFLSFHYLRHNARRLEHLASLGLALHNRKVIEFGAGVGDHSSFYLDRGCTVLATDARTANLDLLHRRLRDHPARDRLTTALVDVEGTIPPMGRFDVVHCYGLLYHLADPAAALAAMASVCDDLFLLETKCAPGDAIDSVTATENAAESYNSAHGRTSRPTRRWLASELRRHFRYLYLPTTTPAHEEFPMDWSDITRVPDGWPRTILLASHTPLSNSMLRTIEA
jgi:SAM-dependent methyltransferase